MLQTRTLLAAFIGLALVAGSARADATDSLKKGTPDIKSIGPLAFGPDGVLFLGDPTGAAIFAIDSGDKGPAATGAVKMENIDQKIASLLGTDAKAILVRDVAVNPASGNIYLSVTRGKAAGDPSVLLRLDRKGKLEEVSLKDVKFAKADLPGASDKSRQEAITCLGFTSGKLLVAGLSNEDWASTLRAIPFPFTAGDKPTGIQIFHGAHGKFETNAPVRTFIPYDIDGQAHVLAAYTCTPLVKIPVAELKPGAKVKGTTIAELGNRNRPLDMVMYQKGGKDYVLIANSSRGIMKVTTDSIGSIKGITDPIKGGGTAGLKYDTIKELQGVEQLAKLDKDNAVVLIRAGSGALNLDTVPLP